MQVVRHLYIRVHEVNTVFFPISVKTFVQVKDLELYINPSYSVLPSKSVHKEWNIQKSSSEE